MAVIRNYLNSWTEGFRERLAWKIFPEMDMYLEIVKRIAEMDENDRCVKALQDADSACEGWAVETIRIKYTSLESMYRQLKEDGFDEPPF
jgi:hypothetical protein